MNGLWRCGVSRVNGMSLVVMVEKGRVESVELMEMGSVKFYRGLWRLEGMRQLYHCFTVVMGFEVLGSGRGRWWLSGFMVKV